VIVAAVIFLLVCLSALVWKRKNLRGTTLTPAWWWAVVAVLGGGGAVLLIACYDQPRWAPAVQFAAACLSFCPSMEILGAKRPQHTAWTFITASLWVVLVLPSAEQVLFQPTQPLEIHDARSFFLLVLMGVCLVNHLPTRFWLPALLLTAAQAAALQPQLPLLAGWGELSLAPVVSLICGGLAVLLTMLWLPDFHSYPQTAGAPQETDAQETDAQAPDAADLGNTNAATNAATNAVEDTPDGRVRPVSLNRVWRDFRDCYGALWSARMLQRVEIAAQQQKWPITLIWTGFINRDDLHQAEPADRRVKLVLMNLLRRFLNPAALP